MFKKGEWKTKGRRCIPPNGKLKVKKVQNSFVYIHAKSATREWGSDVCYYVGGVYSCFEQVDTGGPSKYVHKFRCDNAEQARNPVEFSKDTHSAEAWLDAHNERRQTYHTSYGTDYVPLKWSHGLAASAQAYAGKLRDGFSGCGIAHGVGGDDYAGENLADNTGSGPPASPSNVLSRWVEGELDDPWPENGHLTQVLWRASQYVGCGQVSKTLDSGLQCHIQVCRCECQWIPACCVVLILFSVCLPACLCVLT